MTTTIEYSKPNTFDIIDTLPVDERNVSHGDIEIMNTLFHEKPTMFKKLIKEMNSIALLAILFILFSSSYIDTFINKIITVTNNSHYILITIKALIFAFLYYFIINFYFSKK